jgi:hypothetical protein
MSKLLFVLFIAVIVIIATGTLPIILGIVHTVATPMMQFGVMLSSF